MLQLNGQHREQNENRKRRSWDRKVYWNSWEMEGVEEVHRR
jgi:hypothetical protein